MQNIFSVIFLLALALAVIVAPRFLGKALPPEAGIGAKVSVPRRLGAFLFDFSLAAVIFFIVLVRFFSLEIDAMVAFLAALATQPLFYAWFESSAASGTPGKALFSIGVFKPDACRLSFGRALWRYLSFLIFPLTGFLMAVSDREGLTEGWGAVSVVLFTFIVPIIATAAGGAGVFYGKKLTGWDILSGTVVVRTVRER